MADQTYLLAKKAEKEAENMGITDAEIIAISQDLNILSSRLALIEEKVYRQLIILKEKEAPDKQLEKGISEQEIFTFPTIRL
ncbi:hypothetical protein FTV88_0605 [Heliorestis convoluta]|uniref:Uncharacterized protein n=2 Tax=Heliorestis convoluta TaxID=356322 RepID=A0A5Q2MWE6_9FIRM|nr:hypothetical protein FTV88_0605 [Heliorestis convoluta]